MVFNIQLPFFTADVERATALPDSTFHSQFLNISVENQIPASRQVCRVFHIFPTPYYDYYNKFNKENRFLHRIP